VAADDEHLGVVSLDRVAEYVPGVPFQRLEFDVGHLHLQRIHQHAEHERMDRVSRLIKRNCVHDAFGSAASADGSEQQARIKVSCAYLRAVLLRLV
jgi:hypothetical protein